MGTLLAQQQDLSDIVSIKAIFPALFPDDKSVATTLGSQELRLSSPKRNLIVHKCAVVDQSYKSASNSKQQVGEKLLRPDDLAQHIDAAVAAFSAILLAVSTDS
jgi:hypothetical protein